MLTLFTDEKIKAANQLKQDFTCKICMMEALSQIFLPCGHMGRQILRP